MDKTATLDDIKADTAHILEHICDTDETTEGGVFDWFKKIWNKLTGIPNEIKKLLTGGAMAAIANAALKFSHKVKDGVDLLGSFLGHLQERETVQPTVQNQQAMLTFISGFDEIVSATNDLAARAGIPAPRLQWPDMSWLNNMIPGFLVNLLSMAGNDVYGNWSSLPSDAANKIRGVQLGPNGVTAESAQGAAVALMAVRVIASLLESGKEFVPEDLTLNLDILGEGGGTEVAGHPAKLLFQIPLTVLGAVDPILEYMTSVPAMEERVAA